MRIQLQLQFIDLILQEHIIPIIKIIFNINIRFNLLL